MLVPNDRRAKGMPAAIYTDLRIRIVAARPRGTGVRGARRAGRRRRAALVPGMRLSSHPNAGRYPPARADPLSALPVP